MLLTEEELKGRSKAEADKPKGHVKGWRPVRAGGDTKTPKSRRSLGIPDPLHRRVAHPAGTAAARPRGGWWQDNALVFATETGTELDAPTSGAGSAALPRPLA